MKKNLSSEAPPRLGRWGLVPTWLKVALVTFSVVLTPQLAPACEHVNVSATLAYLQLPSASQAAFFDASGSGSTLNVELRDSYGNQIPLTDGVGGHTYPAVTVTIPAGQAWGLGYLLTKTKPDSTDYLVAPTGVASFIVTPTTGKVNYSTSGTAGYTVGGGNGISATLAAPSALSPTVMVVGGVYYVASGGIVTQLNTLSGSSPGPLPTGAATSANQNKGKALSQLAASVSGSINGLYITGANTIARIVGDNASATTLYLQIFDSTTLPANGSTPIAEVTVGWGISTLPSENEEAFTPDWISTASGVYYVWSTTSGTLTAASSGTGLLVRIYGN